MIVGRHSLFMFFHWQLLAHPPTSMQHRLISPVSVSPVTGYQVYWSGDRGYDSGNLSAGADERTVPITGHTPGLTTSPYSGSLWPSTKCCCGCSYGYFRWDTNIKEGGWAITLSLLLSQTSFPTAACPQVMNSEYLVSAVVGTFISTTLLYTVILLMSICWNKRHR